MHKISSLFFIAYLPFFYLIKNIKFPAVTKPFTEQYIFRNFPRRLNFASLSPFSQKLSLLCKVTKTSEGIELAIKPAFLVTFPLFVDN